MKENELNYIYTERVIFMFDRTVETRLDGRNLIPLLPLFNGDVYLARNLGLIFDPKMKIKIIGRGRTIDMKHIGVGLGASNINYSSKMEVF
jgi:hypothetical protein